MDTNAVHADITETDARSPFDRGADAKRRGLTWFACPYTDHYRSSQWFHGYDSETRKAS